MTAAGEPARPSDLGAPAGAGAPGHRELGGPPDLALGAFSENPPWDLTGKDLPWRADVTELRAATAAQVPELLRRRRFPPGWRVLVTSVRLGWAILVLALGGEAQGQQSWAAGRFPGPGCPAGSARRSNASGRPTSSSARSCPPARASSLPSSSASSGCSATMCRPRASEIVREVVEADLGRPLQRGLRALRHGTLSPPHRSPRSMPPGSAAARTSS